MWTRPLTCQEGVSGVIVIGFDPSNTGYSYGIVGPGTGNRAAIIAHGDRRASTRNAARKHLRELRAEYPEATWAVESVAGYLSAKRVQNQRTGSFDLTDLVDNALWAGLLIGLTPDPDRTVVLPANAMGTRNASWRLYLTRNAKAGSRDVSAALDLFLDGGLPVKSRNAHGQTLAYKINEHERDALGLAVAVYNLKANALSTASGSSRFLS